MTWHMYHAMLHTRQIKPRHAIVSIVILLFGNTYQLSFHKTVDIVFQSMFELMLFLADHCAR